MAPVAERLECSRLFNPKGRLVSIFAASYDPETLLLLEQAFGDAWRELQGNGSSHASGDMAVTRKMMALRIMTAANQGERDPERLSALAVQAVDGRDFG
jgi:hypothetical protein